MEAVTPKFGRGNPLLDRINDMRERAGMGPLDNQPDEPDAHIIDARREGPVGMGDGLPELPQMPYTGSEGDFGGGGASDSWEPEADEETLQTPENNVRDVTVSKSSAPTCDPKAFYQETSFLWGGLVAPIPFAAYQAYKRKARQVTCSTNGGTQVSPQCKNLAVESATHLRCHKESLESDAGDSVKMMMRRQPWGLPLAIAGGLVGAYHGHKKQDGWKTTTAWGAAGLLFPFIAAGVAAWQGFPLYKKK